MPRQKRPAERTPLTPEQLEEQMRKYKAELRILERRHAYELQRLEDKFPGLFMRDDDIPF